MGVPALFRWLSKKYKKIVVQVVEDESPPIIDGNGNTIYLPVDTRLPNPNGFEADNLYLDMNGIVHPCTHPEGKPAPETEEDMMIEIFDYTERLINMTRPRNLLFIAIDGVAPRAKMNQQRSRRFRSVKESEEKQREIDAGIAEFEAMGKTVSDEYKNKKAWDSNAITPGTPFMNFLAESLRYWVAKKMNTDPFWQNLQVIISDASVPGEGEHKIMDFIRRQRVNRGYNPNTQHVIYGLDADLIMLALATHEPNFRVLREDVFAETKACRTCGQEGHFANQCTSKSDPVQFVHSNTSQLPHKTIDKRKPYIFLDVATLREYLEIELSNTHHSFPFELERAIDDWVFLIFLVGNDFLPHLPSLEIREGAIDTLLRIWKTELPRMEGYLTNHGEVILERAEIILEALGRSENDIFRRRKEAEERQDQTAKRRRVEQSNSSTHEDSGTSASHHSITPNSTTVERRALPHRLVDPFSAPALNSQPPGMDALGGSNADLVHNRAAIRMANMTAAEAMKAELAARIPLGRKSAQRTALETFGQTATTLTKVASVPSSDPGEPSSDDQSANLPGSDHSEPSGPSGLDDAEVIESLPAPDETLGNREVVSQQPDDTFSTHIDVRSFAGQHKRKADVLEIRRNEQKESPEEPSSVDILDSLQVDGNKGANSVDSVVQPDGTMDQPDQIRLWEPGYRERYYKQKFGVEGDDVEIRKRITKSYLEGLCWVLRYYYQGTPSWQWFYPYHFAPFAADFDGVAVADIRFELGAPFKPFEQLMGVFPAASRNHLPPPFQSLMVDPDSPILDFYPENFEIDMNGKKMAWQGVALLPFIDQDRLLSAMAQRYHDLTEDEKRRNRWGNNLIMAADGCSLHEFLCGLYTKNQKSMPVALDTSGISGTVMADPKCVPGSTYISPFVDEDMGDIQNDRSISALYFYPKQLSPHRSILLPGVRRPQQRLTPGDRDYARRAHTNDRGSERRFGSDAAYMASMSHSGMINPSSSSLYRGGRTSHTISGTSGGSRAGGPRVYGGYGGYEGDGGIERRGRIDTGNRTSYNGSHITHNSRSVAHTSRGGNSDNAGGYRTHGRGRGW